MFHIFLNIRRPLDRGATRLRSIGFNPASCIASCILHAYILLFLYPVCCMLYPVSWMQPSGWRSVACEAPCYHHLDLLLQPGCPASPARSSRYCVYAICEPFTAPCTSIFLFFGRPGNPPGHQKTMKIIVLSLKFKVLLISKKYSFEVTFGCLLDYFGHHFGRLCAPWGSFWRCLGSQSASKVAKRYMK